MLRAGVYFDSMKRELKGMVVVITGASAGIGRALAEELSASGANLVLAARRAERLSELNALLGERHLAVPTDVAVQSECQRLVEMTMQRYGRIDTLVCNAGYGFLAPVTDTTRQQFEAIFATNVLGTSDCISAVMPQMRKQEPRGGWRGQIMIVSSAVARRGLPFFGAYSATKAAQLSLAEAMRVELADQKIAVTTVHPIGTDTEFGDVSASRSSGKRPGHVDREIRQSAKVVAQKMISGIVRPRPEVWPYRPSRWALGLATLFPRLADRACRAMRVEE